QLAMQALTAQRIQRPAGAGLWPGALQKILQTNIQHRLQMLAKQGCTTGGEQVQGGFVDGGDLPVAIEGEQTLAEQADVLRLRVEAQQVIALAMLQEEAAFDQLRREVGQRHGVEATLP